MKNSLMKSRVLATFSFAVGLLAIPAFAQAGTIGGDLIVQNDGNVNITFAGSNAGYTSTLYLGDTALFSTNSAEGSTISLGNFSAGTVLDFRLEVENTGQAFFTGIGANNVDGVAHSMVEQIGDGRTLVGLEDKMGGGDRDYNDLVFEFSNTTTGGNTAQGKLIANPEPSTIVLLGSGLLGLGAWRLRKKQA